MSMLIERIVVRLLATAFLAIAGAGCNTARGFGKDIQSVGGAFQHAGHRTDNEPTAVGGYNQITDQRIEDTRTAERVREALAATSDYRYDGVKVAVSDGVVQLSGFVNTMGQRNAAGEVAGKVPGAKRVENKLAVKQ